MSDNIKCFELGARMSFECRNVGWGACDCEHEVLGLVDLFSIKGEKQPSMNGRCMSWSQKVSLPVPLASLSSFIDS